MKRFIFICAVLVFPISVWAQATPGGVVTDLMLWLKADNGPLTSGIPSVDGQLVNPWVDQTTVRVNDALPWTASGAPTYRANAADFINYNPVVDFDGVDDGLDFGDDFIFSMKNGVTWFAVVEPDAGPAQSYPYIMDFGGYSTAGYGFMYGLTVCSAYITNINGTSGFGIGALHTFGTAPKLIRYTVDFQTDMTMNLDGRITPFIVNPITTPALGSTQIYAAVTHNGFSGPVTIGHQSKSGLVNNNGGRRLNGSIAELIGYDADLSDAVGGDISRIESYLSIKYGITMDNLGGGTNGDYTSSNGTTIWDASDGSGYHNDVIGIGRDDASALLQKQSRQQDDSTRIYLNLLNASNVGNSGVFTANNQFVLMGHNTEALKSLGSMEYPPGLGIYNRIEREWKVTNTSFGASFSVDITLNTTPLFASDLRILVDLDGDFIDATMYNPVITVSGSTVTIQGLSTVHFPINSVRYFTIVSLMQTTPLPIELLNFEAFEQNRMVHLLWSTASELNNDYFTIQRSCDVELWEDFIMVDGAGSTVEQQNYSAIDSSPLFGTSYYRLKQTDFNGNTSCFDIRSVTIEERNAYIDLFPNPTKGLINLNGNPDEWEEIHVYNALGQEVTPLIPQIGKDYSTLILDLTYLSSGVYTIRTKTAMTRVNKL